MWNNGFGNPGKFQNFSPGDFQQMAFGGIPPQGQQFYTPQGMMQMNQSIDDDPMDGEYHPELSFANQRSFMQNQNIGAPFSSPPSINGQATQPAATVLNPRVPTQMNARAAELKAKLLKRKEEQTPPVLAPVATAKEAARPENLKRAASISQKSTDDKREQDLNELISQYSVPKATNGTPIKQEKKSVTVPTIEQIPTSSATSTMSQAPTSKTATSVNKAKPQAIENKAQAPESIPMSRSVSEGEILEDTQSSTQAKETQVKGKASRPEEPLPRASREDHSVKPQYSRSREEPRYSSPSSSRHVLTLNGRGDRREEVDRMERRRNTSDSVVHHGNRYTEPERQLHPRRDSRDEEKRHTQTNGAHVRAEPNRAVQSKPPSLQDLLPLDEDLREWLEITGYHNEDYRNKILNCRRAIAALDAQRDKLLAEMAAEERGVPPLVVLQSTPSMLPPPNPNKVGSHVEPKSTASVTEQRASNKRSYSEAQDVSDALNTEKIARVEEKGHPTRIKEENNESRRPRSSGFDSGRRFSPARRGSSDSARQRFERRSRSPERGSSPGRRAYDNRPPARDRGYDTEDYFRRDTSNERRPVEIHGAYVGRAFDPDFHSRRGRGGRGRGGRGEFRDPRDYQGGSDYKNDSPFGSRIANGRPYRDNNGFGRGGRGDTRYFIVKSFNEENVLKCIEDSVWTTQAQNGPLFKEAFESCKNVILVFSINKSRAFQGYARMESLPGSVEVPDWQRAINWESAGAFKVKWLVICATRFHRVGHLKNPYNDNQAVLIGKDGQEIEENCGAGLIQLIDEEADNILGTRLIKSEEEDWDDRY